MATTALSKFREMECVRWFRGLSVEQIAACNKLVYALRDDTEQDTTYRVRRCFSQLGLVPAVPSQRIKAIMKISHCNDLALLWFIWEAEYKQPRDGIDIDNEPYTANEQLLFSAMAHLDMPSTLKALDEILPPPSHSKKFANRKTKQVHLSRRETSLGEQNKLSKYLSPYLAPLVRPKQFVPKKTVLPADRKVEFPEYSQYKDPMYEIPNDKSRWFSQYELSPEKRIIKRVLTDELDRLFFKCSGLNTQDEENALCSTHKSLAEAMELKHKELSYEALEKCMAQLDVAGAEKKARRKRIAKSLEREIQCAADKMQQFSRRQLTHLTLLRSDKIDANCRLCKSLVSTPAQKKGRQADLALLMHANVKQIGHPMPPDEECSPVLKVLQLRGEEKPHSCRDLGSCIMVQNGTLRSGQVKISESDMLSRSLGGGNARRSTRSGRLWDLKKNAITPNKPTSKFRNLNDLIPFCGKWKRCVNNNAPHSQQESFIAKSKYGIQLDYFKVFDPPELPPLQETDMQCETGEFYIDIDDKQTLIERYCVNALNKTLKDGDEMENWDNTNISDSALGPPSVKKAIDKCAVNIFRAEKAIREQAELNDSEISADGNSLLKMTNIDPDNRDQMVELLKIGLKILRHNRHYVLATFSNAHKLPILVDWVANRYGKSYNRTAMDQLVNASVHVCERLGQRRSNPLGKLLRMDIRGLASYADHDRIMRNAQCMKMNYYHDLNEKELEHSRLIWLALRGYSHLSGNFGNTFFAYMPSRDSDIRRDKIWKNSDYRDMVETRVTIRHRKAQK